MTHTLNRSRCYICNGKGYDGVDVRSDDGDGNPEIITVWFCYDHWFEGDVVSETIERLEA